MNPLPCPFCGGAPTITEHFMGGTWNLIHRCAVVGPITIGDAEEKRDLVEQWNTRHLPSLDVSKLSQAAGPDEPQGVQCGGQSRGITPAVEVGGQPRIDRKPPTSKVAPTSLNEGKAHRPQSGGPPQASEKHPFGKRSGVDRRRETGKVKLWLGHETEKARLFTTLHPREARTKHGRKAFKTLWVPKSITHHLSKEAPDEGVIPCVAEIEDWFIEKQGL